MALKVDASFDDGVFVPAQRPALADHERVRLTIEPARQMPARSTHGDGLIHAGSRTDHNLAVARRYAP